MPGLTLASIALAAAHGQLGEKEAARSAMYEPLALKPDYAVVGRRELGKIGDPQLVEHLIDGLREAGREIADAQASAPAKPAAKSES